MFLKLKGFKYKYLSETILVTYKLKKLDQSHCEIAYQLEISKFFIIIIFY